mgnify:FL=1
MTVTDRQFDAVLFDWCGTLVEYPTREQRFARVLERLGRPHDPQSVVELARAFATAEQHPDAIESDRHCDLSASNHEETKLLVCKLAGIDDELAAAIEQSYGDLTTYRTYPEVVDVIMTLHRHDIEIAIVSDFHLDLRPYFASLGILDCISGFAISYEVGAVKPDRRMFDAALNTITSPAHRCLMVGDNPGPDTGAAAVGITTLIIPVERVDRPALLHRVTALAVSSI